MKILSLILMYILFATTSARVLKLSKSFSFEGSLVVDAANVTVTFPRYNLTHDAVRKLQHLDLIEITPEGRVDKISINNGYENKTHIVSEGKCEEKVLQLQKDFSTFDTNTWTLFEKAEELRDGVYSVHDASYKLQLTTKNGLPTSYITTILLGTDIINTRFFFTTYRNETPPFYVFSLPDECSQYTCGYCYNSAAGVAGSFFLLLSVIIISLLSLM